MPDDSFVITIEKIVSGGYGLGRLPDGMIVLTPLVLPGEKIRVRPVRQKKNYLEARLTEIIEPSSLRIEPVCPYFGKCGGCDLQHLETKNQLLLKNNILKEQLLRFKIIPDENTFSVICSDPFPSARSFNYRQRIRLQVDKENQIGYFRFRTHKVEPIKTCPLARPEINAVLEKLPTSGAMRNLLENCRELEFFLSPDDNQVVLYLHFLRKPRPADLKAGKSLVRDIEKIKDVVLEAEGHGVFNITNSENPKGKDNIPHINITLPAKAAGRGITLSCEPGGFYQVNQEANEELIKTVLEWADVGAKDRVLDLFCGIGNFSLPLAFKAGEVVGLDMQRSAIRSAKRNADSAGLSNCRFEKNAAKAGAEQLTETNESFDLILLDPPRQGCFEVIPFIPKLGAARIIYISCDPTTLARDLGELLKAGYNLCRMKVVDMFPQTHHMETVALLEKI